LEYTLVLYLLLIGLTCTTSFFKFKLTGIQRTVIAVCLSASFPIFLSAFRYGNGADYFLYERIFKTFCNGQIFHEVKSLELGYIVLTEICSTISNSPFFFFLINALLINIFFFWGIYKESCNVPLSILFFFITGTFFDSFNGLRQYIATAIIFCSYKYILEKNKKEFLLTVLLASLFHYSALIMIPIYYISRYRLTMVKTTLLLLSEVIAGSFIYQIITYLLQFTRYSFFLTSVEYKIDITYGSILYTTIITIVCYIYLNNKKGAIGQMLTTLQVIICACSLTSLFIPLSARLQYYFLPFEIIIIPEIIKSIKIRSNKILISMFFIVMYSAIVGYGMICNDWFNAIPYHLYPF